MGVQLEGTVTSVRDFGAFVDLGGIEGMVHVSKLGTGGRVRHPEEVLKSGDRVAVSIEGIDHERRRISLSMEDTLGNATAPEPAAEPAPAAVAAEAPAETPAAAATPPVPAGPVVAPGSRLTGTVEGIREFGVFVKLPNGQTGLLHISEVQLRGSSNKRRALYDTFKPGTTVEVVVREIDGRRVSLTLPETLDREAEEIDLKDLKDRGGEGLGSLGDVLGKIQLPPA